MTTSLPVVFQKEGQFPIAKNNQLGVLQHIGPQFVISFELLFNSIEPPPPWGFSILHFTDKNHCCANGERIPALWYFVNPDRFYVSSSISGDGDNALNIDFKVKTNTWYHMEISQLLKDNGEVSNCNNPELSKVE